MTSKEMRATEAHDPKFDGLDTWPTADILEALCDGQARAVEASQRAIPDLAKAVDAAADRLANGKGRLVYVGAGTSGRLGLLDGIELTPTFGWPSSRCVFLFAGGMEGLQKSIEGAEDDVLQAGLDVANSDLGPNDVVLALAASGTTPYTLEGVRKAKERGALTIGFANNPGAPLLNVGDFGILLESGAEVLSGSTRLGAGTAQKATLGLFSTALMARLGKVFDGYMVDMLPTNDKLVARAVRMVSSLTGCEEVVAQSALKASNNKIKEAVLIATGATLSEAEAALRDAKGHLRAALEALPHA